MSARDDVKRIASELEQHAIAAHSQGISLSRRSARVEQLPTVGTDEQCTALFRALLDEGLIGPDGSVSSEFLLFKSKLITN